MMNLSIIRSLGVIMALVVAGVSGQAIAQSDAPKANEVVPVVDGEVFDRIIIVKSEDYTSSLEVNYTRTTDDAVTWSKQVSYIRLQDPEINTAKKYAKVAIDALGKVTPNAKYQASSNEDGSIILLDFVVNRSDMNFIEFNLYRIEEGEQGVYSIRMVSRVPLLVAPTKENMAPVIEMRKQWLAQSARFDMAKIKQMLDAL
jgi:hypothetical protein